VVYDVETGRLTATSSRALRLSANRELAGAYAGRILFLGAVRGLWFFTTQLRDQG
jgi:hypothetical protein